MTQQEYFRKINRLKEIEKAKRSVMPRWKQMFFVSPTPPIFWLLWKLNIFPKPWIFRSPLRIFLGNLVYFIIMIGAIFYAMGLRDMRFFHPKMLSFWIGMIVQFSFWSTLITYQFIKSRRVYEADWEEL